MKYLLPILVFAWSCARPYPPTGGEADRLPPQVVRITPTDQSVSPSFAGAVVFEFDETLSERGITDEILLVSPETGEPKLERDGNRLKVSLEGGWRAGQVYRVVISPGVADRFGNARREPAEVVFSTGPELTPTALGGVVLDRITGRPAAGVRVVALDVRDSTQHTTVTDTAGFFGIRFLPVSRFLVQAYEDANRNRKLDAREKFASTTVNIGTVRDTIPDITLNLLAPDTTPARLLRAEARDSMEVRVTFDDYLDPDQPTSELTVSLFKLPDSTAVPGGRLLTERELDRQRLAADSARARADTTFRLPPRPPGAAAADTARVLPTQELVFVPAAPLEPRTRYRIFVGNARNIAGLRSGGGSAPFTTRARATRDTTQLRRDTSSVPETRRFR